ncbi:disease resistance protein [Senna tora]|uniref:Disease resistance protein n=1 Tax=Senna tora TaxID=362788 RepID=A0A834T4N4_9FABA|nr:disease resistance protein [Senna tora]
MILESGQRILVILGDVWEKLNLEDIGSLYIVITKTDRMFPKDHEICVEDLFRCAVGPELCGKMSFMEDHIINVDHSLASSEVIENCCVVFTWYNGEYQFPGQLDAPKL